MISILKHLWDSPTFTTWGSFLTVSLKSVILLPILLLTLSKHDFTLWLLFSSILAFSNILDLGFYSSLSRQYSYLLGGSTDFKYKIRVQKIVSSSGINKDLFGKLYSSTHIVFIVLGILSFLILAIFGTLSIKRTILANPDPFMSWLSWSVIVLTFPFLVYGKKYRSILHGFNYIPMLNRWDTLFNGITAIFLVIAALSLKSILALIIINQGMLLLTIIRNRVLLFYVVKIVDVKEAKYSGIDRTILKDIWKPTWRTGVGIFASSGVVELTGIIYSNFGTIDSLASYLLGIKILSLLSNISKAPFYSRLPLFSKMRASGDIHALSVSSKKYIAISLHIFSLGIFVVGLSIPLIISFLSRDITFLDINMWTILGFIWLLERHHAMHAQVYSTTNHIPFYIPILISGTVYLAISFTFVESFGIWAFIFAHGISNVMINNWWNVKLSYSSLGSVDSQYVLRTIIEPIAMYCLYAYIMLSY
jgi:hypothetical protein